MICKCESKMKCVDSRARAGQTNRKWVCPACDRSLKTVERPQIDWECTQPKALDQLAIRLDAVSTLTKEAVEIINSHILKGEI